MFTRLAFDFDCDGKKREKPLVLTAADTRSKCYYLETATYRSMGSYGDLPAVHVCRSYARLDTDPYNEDGRPPSVMCILVLPVVSFMGRAVEIFGFERANMCWAGQPVPAYDYRPPLRVPKNRLWPLAEGHKKYSGRYSMREAPHGLDHMHRQRLVLR